MPPLDLAHVNTRDFIVAEEWRSIFLGSRVLHFSPDSVFEVKHSLKGVLPFKNHALLDVLSASRRLLAVLSRVQQASRYRWSSLGANKKTLN